MGRHGDERPQALPRRLPDAFPGGSGEPDPSGRGRGV